MMYMNYPGGKSGTGVYQKIINQMPPHDVYIESFVGGGAVLALKRPASTNIVIDSDKDVIKYWRRSRDLPGLIAINGDAISLLPELVEQHAKDGARVLVYNDPPYPGDVRLSKRPIYNHEMMSDDDHVELLRMLKALPCMVMISSYWSELYERELGWRSINFPAMTRRGPAVEHLWMSFPEPFELHDYQYLGEGYRERERIKKKKMRWKMRLQEMPPLERYALLEAVALVRDGGAGSAR